MQALRQRLSDGSAAAVVMEHIQESARLSLRGTPSVFFNGREYRGPLNLAAMERSAREAIASTKLSSQPALKQVAKEAPKPTGLKPSVKTKPAPALKPKAAPSVKVTSKPSPPQPPKPAAKAAPKTAPGKTP